MHPLRTATHALLLPAALLALAACSGDPATPVAVPSGPPGASASPSPTGTVPVPVDTPSPGATATASGPVGTPTSTPSTGGGTGGGCASSALALSVGPPGAAAGTTYRALRLRNTGAAACPLTGWPGVSFLDRGGRQVGLPASRDTGTAARVVLQPGGTASALLAVSNAGNYDPATCRPSAVVTVKVYPPGQRDALTAPLAETVCAGDVRTARVAPMQPGPGPDQG